MTVNHSSCSLTVYAWLSIAAAVATITLKSYAYWLTDSVGLLSDAMESLINLAAAVIALLALTVAAKPPDEKHAYGHEKVEYFSSGAEGVLILLAAISIMWVAWERLLHPQPIRQLDIGLVVSAIASLINLLVARVLIRVGKRRQSITLEADGRHLLTDVWTTAGVIAGVGVIAGLQWLGYQGWERLDPIIAILVAVNIVWTGIGLMRRTFAGLMDVALDSREQETIIAILDEFVRREGIAYHALRTRYSGSRRFISVHILVPGVWTVQQGHDLLELIESRISRRFDSIDIDTHLEPIEDIVSWRHNH
ncbi:cation diffusion facilitator family transporter [Methylomarinum sp. Ch1-1]|uniref:Cation diffusion facilitator family transporter n=1 Tax=Methylomarinum roseum TaxID=3067653 RepID=A0AAU7NZJ3_9GAMM|nr:cation diffusion facilitator family transporter [Methylomarinum sp. Ch1-1]MDP4521522.1 cation diffusion facilitator family transporter [Methylomarinum sp. Ch1-1]